MTKKGIYFIFNVAMWGRSLRALSLEGHILISICPQKQPALVLTLNYINYGFRQWTVNSYLQKKMTCKHLSCQYYWMPASTDWPSQRHLKLTQHIFGISWYWSGAVTGVSNIQVSNITWLDKVFKKYYFYRFRWSWAAVTYTPWIVTLYLDFLIDFKPQCFSQMPEH